VIHTREEAIARAKAWVDNVGGSRLPWEEVYPGGLCPDPANGVDWEADIFCKPIDGGGHGGTLLVSETPAGDTGVVVAVVHFQTKVKTFRWKA
jgi:hypothetical protein